MKKYDYLLDILKKDKTLKILLLSHNSYWTELQIIQDEYKNLELTFNGGSVIYLDINRYQLEKDYDLILLYSSDEYDEEELLKLKDIALKISINNNKRVSIGYSYILPSNEIINDNILEQIILASFKNNIENSEKKDSIEYFNTLDLTTMTLSFHNELEYIKVRKKSSITPNNYKGQ